MNAVRLDLLIIGGGIAGLWTLNRAVQAGYNAVLLEKEALGAGQSIRSQGIIHGGLKYSLKGVLAPSGNALREMPERWRTCLEGRGDVDLSSARVLSDAHYMWSRGTLGSKMASFLASKAMSGRIGQVAAGDFPEVFNHRDFRGTLYRMSELVLDVPTVISALAGSMDGRLFKVNAAGIGIHRNRSGGIESIHLPALDCDLKPRRVVVAAGEGFEALADPMGLKQQKMQRRPLHMIMAKHRANLPIYAHCIGTGARPLMTITTHYCRDGAQVWYFGGDIAETGVGRDADAQIRHTQGLLQKTLPWVKLQDAQWSTLRVDRAEPAQTAAILPDTAFAKAFGDVIAAWPTKLALAPVLADKVLAQLPPPAADPDPLSTLAALPRPEVASPVWEIVF